MFANRSGGEFFTSAPKGYKPGKIKYIVFVGTVISGLGKGVAMAALARLLKENGFKVSPIKFDGYLNVDAGTLNPFRHGEVFVLDDGTECDMDLGTYERFLDENLSSINYLTAGKLFKKILEKERKGEYLGRDVQFIPHVTGEIKYLLRDLGMKTDADIVMVEVGGTIGDIENSYFIEAIRQMQYEEGMENIMVVALVYIMKPSTLGEQKSKAAQLGIRTLMGMGLRPNIIVCRAEDIIEEKVKQKISIAANVPLKNVIDAHNVKTIYELVLNLKSQNVDEIVLQHFGLKTKKIDLEAWRNFVSKIVNAGKEVTVGMAGKYTQLHDSYASIIEALSHASAKNNCKVRLKWIETTQVEGVEKQLEGVDGLIVPGGFGSRGVEGKIEAVKHAREKKIPFLGLCYGFQMAVIEHARHLLGMKSAHTTEVDPYTEFPVIDLLPEQKRIKDAGGTMRLGGQDVIIEKGTKAYEIYKKEKVRERFRHRYECNPDFVDRLQEKGLIFSGYAPGKRIMQILERTDHPFFLATQFHPEFTSRPLKPSPIFDAFVKACLQARNK
ncbi:CTP synthetase [Candidatus Micrarchaeota archaeon]|nr:MAG: CTP synthetase [Candidatus Micrarchaeota archaeon]